MKAKTKPRKVDRALLQHPSFPLSSKYDSNWIIENSMGPNVLWLTEWLCQELKLKPGMKVLDLGCGRAISSIFLAKEFGVTVWASDLRVKANDNWERIKKAGFEDKVFPLDADARDLPYTHDFFDCIMCIDSYIYFGTDDLYLDYLSKFIKKSGYLAVVVPGLVSEFPSGRLPKHLKNFWGQDCWSWHTLDWWKNLWEKTGLVSIKNADSMPNFWKLYLNWKLAQEKANTNPWPDDIKVIKEDRGEYIGLHRLIARRKEIIEIPTAE